MDFAPTAISFTIHSRRINPLMLSGVAVSAGEHYF